MRSVSINRLRTKLTFKQDVHNTHHTCHTLAFPLHVKRDYILLTGREYNSKFNTESLGQGRRLKFDRYVAYTYPDDF